MNSILVSIIIPTYNREGLIGETLDSILSQTYQNWECILVDDRSTDDTLKVVESYCSKDNRFKLLKRDQYPKGAPTCRNIGLMHATGEFLMFFDSDDVLFPHAIKERTDFLQHHPNLDFCVSDGIRGKYPIRKENDYFIISTFKLKDVLPQFFNFTIPWNTMNPLYRRISLVNKKIRWSENVNVYQDIDFHIKCILAGLQFDYCHHDPDFLWREHDHGNIGGKELNSNVNGIKKKLVILKNFYNHPTLTKNDILPLQAYFIQLFLYSNVPVKLYGDFFIYIYRNPLKRFFLKTLFSIYKWLYKKNIKKFKVIAYLILIKLKQGKYMIPQKNEYFLIKPYFPVIE